MRATEVNKILAEKPALREGDYFLLRSIGGQFQERVRISRQVENYLRRYRDCDFMILSKDDLEWIAWK